MKISLHPDDSGAFDEFVLRLSKHASEPMSLSIRSFFVPDSFAELKQSLLNLQALKAMPDPDFGATIHELLQQLIYNDLIVIAETNNCLGHGSVDFSGISSHKKLFDYFQTRPTQGDILPAIGVPWFAGERESLFIGYFPQKDCLLLSQTSERGLGPPDLSLNEQIDLSDFIDALMELSHTAGECRELIVECSALLKKLRINFKT